MEPAYSRTEIWCAHATVDPAERLIRPHLGEEDVTECGVLETELHVTLYFQTHKILEVYNDICYNGVNSKCKLICILGYTKLRKSDKFCSLEMCTIHYKIYQNLLFLCSLEYEVVYIDILHHCSIHN
jgi:hypothetical protein